MNKLLEKIRSSYRKLAMPRSREPKRPLHDPNDPDYLGTHARRYLDSMMVRNYSPNTVTLWEEWLRYFLDWCDERSIRRPVEVTRVILERYQRHWHQYRKANGRPLSFGTQLLRLVPVRGLFRWLVRQNVIASNPAADLELPRTTKALPKAVLTANEADAIINVPDVNTSLGLRDRAILEVLYSTGIRRMELVQLALHDLDAERGTLRVRRGKGGKARVVPIGERALRWTEKYIETARPKLLRSIDDGVLFVNADGKAIDHAYLSHLVREYVVKADIGKLGSCHLFRHSCATLMLEGGADVRFVQEMLGHAQLSTTEVYTHVAISKLVEVHRRTHPAATMKAPVKTEPTTTADDLLDAIAGEDDD